MARVPVACASVLVVAVLLAACSSSAGAGPTPVASPTRSADVRSSSPTARAPAGSAVPTPGPTAIAGAPGSGQTVSLAVLGGPSWSVSEIAVPAGQTWTVRIAGEPSDSHNFTVLTGPYTPGNIVTGSSGAVFHSPDFGDGTATYTIPALPAGKYTFVCTIHPDVMFGVLMVR